MRIITTVVTIGVCMFAVVGICAADEPSTDSRLEQKVTYEARRKTVSAILVDLSKMTGVTLKAGYNDLDWQVRDRRMNIFAKDVPLKSLMNSISRVMKFKWSKSDRDGTWTYRLYMDRRTLVDAERQASIEEQRLARMEAEQRTRVLDDLTKAAAMSDEELEQLKQDKPMLYVWAKAGWPALMPELFAQAPEAMNAWLNGEALTLNAANLPVEAQQAVLKTFKVMGGFLGQVISPEYDPSTNAVNDLGKYSVSINFARSFLGYRGDTFIGDVTLHWPGGDNRTGFMNPDSETAKKIGRDYISVLEGQPVGEQKANQMNIQHMQAVEQQKADFGEPLIEHQDDPALSVKVKLKLGGGRFDDLLSAVAKASGFAVVSDSFRTNYKVVSMLDLLKKEVPLKEVLDRITLACRYNWQRHGSTLEFRDRDWFYKRSAQVPESWLEPWRKTLEDTETLDLDQLSQIASLDYEQLRENITPDDVLGSIDLPLLLFHYGDLLRAYGCLGKIQRKAILSDKGLDLGSISQSQWTTVSRVLRRKAAFTGSTDDAITLQGKRKQIGRWFNYSFAAVTSTGQTLLKQEFTTPQYDIIVKINSLPWTDVGARALDLFEEAKKVKLSETEQWQKLGIVLCDGRYYPQALEALEQVTALAKIQSQERFLSLVWKGHILDLMGRREGAINAYKDALNMDSSYEVGYASYDMVINRKWIEDRLKTPFKRR